jgi:hypothetical protein
MGHEVGETVFEATQMKLLSRIGRTGMADAGTLSEGMQGGLDQTFQVEVM